MTATVTLGGGGADVDPHAPSVKSSRRTRKHQMAPRHSSARNRTRPRFVSSASSHFDLPVGRIPRFFRKTCATTEHAHTPIFCKQIGAASNSKFSKLFFWNLLQGRELLFVRNPAFFLYGFSLKLISPVSTTEHPPGILPASVLPNQPNAPQPLTYSPTLSSALPPAQASETHIHPPPISSVPLSGSTAAAPSPSLPALIAAQTPALEKSPAD